MPINEFVFFFIHYLGTYTPGCAAFAQVSPNVVADESVMKTDEGMSMEQRYTVVSVLTCVNFQFGQRVFSEITLTKGTNCEGCCRPVGH